MERREQGPPLERLADVIGLRVTDPAGTTLGVVVGRIRTGATIDLLVRGRRLFRRSRYLRLQGRAITAGEHTLVYHRATERRRVNLGVVETSGDGDPARGDAA
ncbi:MAG TPA: hypothetical protein VLU92_02530 [Candidatus Dormibacteraeota bacterium]|nr:hypothetical protein [Candidatus Dormibacteraeota bacterium]